MAYVPNGYPRLASLMSKEKDVAIFRRFDELNILSLLALQAEIIDLENDLSLEWRLEDALSHESEQKQSNPVLNSENFWQSRKNNSVPYQKINDLRNKLKEYNELALQVSQLNVLNEPILSQMEALKDWLRDEKGKPFLSGHEAETWVENKNRYMCLKPPNAESDPFTRYTSNVLLGLYHRLVGQTVGTGQTLWTATGHTSYSNASINRVSNIITTILASIMPVLNIYVLNQLSTVNQQIGVTAAFSAAFACTIALFSSARRVDIFLATATFSAVAVVFIGTEIQGSTSTPPNAAA